MQVAGTGTCATASVGPALSACLKGPWDMAVYNPRILLLTDQTSCHLRGLDMDMPSGDIINVWPVAGSGTCVSTMGNLDAAQINKPGGILVASNTKIYVTVRGSSARTFPLLWMPACHGWTTAWMRGRESYGPPGFCRLGPLGFSLWPHNTPFPACRRRARTTCC